MMKEKLVIGSAGKKHDDAMTIDIEPEHNPDIIHDISIAPFPFKDNQFKEIICHHVLEHLDDLAVTMSELNRICHPDGFIYIEVPYHTSWCANTPGHKLKFNYFAFDEYCAEVDTWNKGVKFKLLEREVTFHRAFRRYGLHKLFNKFPLVYERFWTYMIPAEHLKVKIQPLKK